MSQTALYSAEQIEVFGGLTDLLKDYAKEVIRAHPTDLLVFSRDYFAKLAEQSKNEKPVTKEQLISLRSRLLSAAKDTKVSRDFLISCCEEVQIPKISAERVLREMHLQHSDLVDHTVFVVLCCGLVADSLFNAVSILIAVWGGIIEPREVFVELVSVFTQRDRAISAEFQDHLKSFLEEKKITSVSEADWNSFLQLEQQSSQKLN